MTAEGCSRAAEAPEHWALVLDSICQGTKLGDSELMGNVFPPFRFNSSVRHLSEMVLFTHSSREMAEQRGSFFYASCYLCSLGNVAEFNGCITRPCVCASVHEREGEREAAEQQGHSPEESCARW